ncbi:MAG: ATP synthase F1 subunit delta [Bacteroidota bacterium]|nr:ATP synthase F1 subunit delta [Bacteroidota bacterium]
MVVAIRYAKSLLGLAVERGLLEEVYKDMMHIREICYSNRDFVAFLESPVIKTDKKQEILTELFKGKINDLTFAFINIITEKRREGYVDDIAKAFDGEYKKHKNILSAVITSAAGIDATTRAKVMELVKATTTGEVELTEKIDKDLIGGFVIKIGDNQVDASVSRTLNDLRKNFSENPFVKEF